MISNSSLTSKKFDFKSQTQLLLNFFILHAFSCVIYRFLPSISGAIKPFLPPLSVLVTSLCVGAPLAININSVLSPFGISVLLLVTSFHISAFVLGYAFTGIAFHNEPEVKPLQRTLSYETGSNISFYCNSNTPKNIFFLLRRFANYLYYVTLTKLYFI